MLGVNEWGRSSPQQAETGQKKEGQSKTRVNRRGEDKTGPTETTIASPKKRRRTRFPFWNSHLGSTAPPTDTTSSPFLTSDTLGANIEN